MPLVFPYSRVSTGRQADETRRSGISRQAEALRSWLADWPEYTVAQEIGDFGVSAFRGGNQHRSKGLGRWLAAARKGRIPAGSVLLVEDFRRYSRREPVDAIGSVIKDIWDCGLGFAVCNYERGRPLFKADAKAQHLALLSFLFEQGHAESQEKSRWSAAARAKERERQERGERIDGRTPWWIARDPSTGGLVRDANGGLVVDPEHGRAIHRAVDLAINGLGMELIAERLTEEGFSSPLTVWGMNGHRAIKKRGWSAGVVSRVLRHPALVGTLRRRDAELPGYYPRLLTDEEHHRLRASIEQRNRMKGRIRGLSRKTRNLFQGVARCGVCGGPISYSAPAKRARVDHPGFVACRSGNRREGGRCHNKGYLLYDQFESHCLTRLSTALWEQLLRRPEDDADRAQLEQEVGALQGERDRLQGRLKAAEQKLANLWEKGASETRQEIAEARVKEIRAQLATTTARLTQTQQQLEAARARPTSQEAATELRQRVIGFWQHLPEASPEQRQDFNRWLLARQPEIRFLVHPLPEGAANSARPIELVVGDETAGVEPLAPLARQLARQKGIPDSVLARDRKVGPPELATVGKGRKGQPVIEIHGLAGEEPSREQIEDVVAGAAAALELRDPQRQEELRKAIQETDMGNEPDGTIR